MVNLSVIFNGYMTESLRQCPVFDNYFEAFIEFHWRFLSALTEQQSLNKFSFIRHSQKYSLWAKVYSKLALPAPFISESYIKIKIKLNFYFALLCGASKGSMKTLNTFWDAKVQNQKFKLIFFLCPRSGQEGLLIKTLE